MAYQLARLDVPCLKQHRLEEEIDRLLRSNRPRLARLWAYYRNPLRTCSATAGDADRPYRQAQEWGLPARITGVRRGREIEGAEPLEGLTRKEVVIENDIAWRIETQVDYLFGKPLVMRSTAADPARRETIDRLVRAIIAHNGGILFLQQLALLGAVYGFVDVLVKLDPEAMKTACAGEAGAGASTCGLQELGEPPAGAGAPVADVPRRPPARAASPGSAAGITNALPTEAGAAPAEDDALPAADADHPPQADDSPAASDDPADTGATNPSLEALIQRLARMIRLEIVEPARAVPLLAMDDWRTVEAYAQVFEMPRTPQPAACTDESPARWWQRLRGAAGQWFAASAQRPDGRGVITEIISATRWQRYEDQRLIAEGSNALGQVPLVHIQNTAVPFEYSGASDVEPLMPLQDELNTRLSDRAYRITMESFRMYLAKGIENSSELPIAPGRIWSTDNENAEIQELGGDASAPSESLHIADLREALDKSSGVSPVAAGAIKNRIGRLTSAAALRITLISLLARTEKKRTTYGMGLARMVELALAWLDRAGLFATAPEERRIELHWPSPLPENILEKLQEAEAKSRLGVPREVILRELGY